MSRTGGRDKNDYRRRVIGFTVDGRVVLWRITLKEQLDQDSKDPQSLRPDFNNRRRAGLTTRLEGQLRVYDSGVTDGMMGSNAIKNRLRDVKISVLQQPVDNEGTMSIAIMGLALRRVRGFILTLNLYASEGSGGSMELQRRFYARPIVRDCLSDEPRPEDSVLGSVRLQQLYFHGHGRYLFCGFGGPSASLAWVDLQEPMVNSPDDEEGSSDGFQDGWTSSEDENSPSDDGEKDSSEEDSDDSAEKLADPTTAISKSTFGVGGSSKDSLKSKKGKEITEKLSLHVAHSLDISHFSAYEEDSSCYEALINCEGDSSDASSFKTLYNRLVTEHHPSKENPQEPKVSFEDWVSLYWARRILLPHRFGLGGGCWIVKEGLRRVIVQQIKLLEDRKHDQFQQGFSGFATPGGSLEESPEELSMHKLRDIILALQGFPLIELSIPAISTILTEVARELMNHPDLRLRSNSPWKPDRSPISGNVRKGSKGRSEMMFSLEKIITSIAFSVIEECGSLGSKGYYRPFYSPNSDAAFSPRQFNTPGFEGLIGEVYPAMLSPDGTDGSGSVRKELFASPGTAPSAFSIQQSQDVEMTSQRSPVNQMSSPATIKSSQGSAPSVSPLEAPDQVLYTQQFGPTPCWDQSSLSFTWVSWLGSVGSEVGRFAGREGKIAIMSPSGGLSLLRSTEEEHEVNSCCLRIETGLGIHLPSKSQRIERLSALAYASVRKASSSAEGSGDGLTRSLSGTASSLGGSTGSGVPMVRGEFAGKVTLALALLSEDGSKFHRDILEEGGYIDNVSRRQAKLSLSDEDELLGLSRRDWNQYLESYRDRIVKLRGSNQAGDLTFSFLKFFHLPIRPSEEERRVTVRSTRALTAANLNPTLMRKLEGSKLQTELHFITSSLSDLLVFQWILRHRAKLGKSTGSPSKGSPVKGRPLTSELAFESLTRDTLPFLLTVSRCLSLPMVESKSMARLALEGNLAQAVDLRVSPQGALLVKGGNLSIDPTFYWSTADELCLFYSTKTTIPETIPLLTYDLPLLLVMSSDEDLSQRLVGKVEQLLGDLEVSLDVLETGSKEHQRKEQGLLPGPGIPTKNLSKMSLMTGIEDPVNEVIDPELFAALHSLERDLKSTRTALSGMRSLPLSDHLPSTLVKCWPRGFGWDPVVKDEQNPGANYDRESDLYLINSTSYVECRRAHFLMESFQNSDDNLLALLNSAKMEANNSEDAVELAGEEVDRHYRSLLISVEDSSPLDCLPSSQFWTNFGLGFGSGRSPQPRYLELYHELLEPGLPPETLKSRQRLVSTLIYVLHWSESHFGYFGHKQYSSELIQWCMTQISKVHWHQNVNDSVAKHFRMAQTTPLGESPNTLTQGLAGDSEEMEEAREFLQKDLLPAPGFSSRPVAKILLSAFDFLISVLKDFEGALNFLTACLWEFQMDVGTQQSHSPLNIAATALKRLSLVLRSTGQVNFLVQNFNRLSPQLQHLYVQDLAEKNLLKTLYACSIVNQDIVLAGSEKANKGKSGENMLTPTNIQRVIDAVSPEAGGSRKSRNFKTGNTSVASLAEDYASDDSLHSAESGSEFDEFASPNAFRSPGSLNSSPVLNRETGASWRSAQEGRGSSMARQHESIPSEDYALRAKSYLGRDGQVHRAGSPGFLIPASLGPVSLAWRHYCSVVQRSNESLNKRFKRMQESVQRRINVIQTLPGNILQHIVELSSVEVLGKGGEPRVFNSLVFSGKKWGIQPLGTRASCSSSSGSRKSKGKGKGKGGDRRDSLIDDFSVVDIENPCS